MARKQEAKRQLIVQAAMGLVAEEGLGGLTIPKLSKRLDWTVGALYRYFEGKGAIITAMQLKAVETYGVHMKAAWRDAAAFAGDAVGAPLVPIIALAHEYQRLVQVLPTEYHLINQVLAIPDTMLPEEDANRVIVPMLGLIMDIVQPLIKAQAIGVLTPGNALYRLLGYWISAVGLLQLQKIERHNPTVVFDDLIMQTVETFLLGWGADPEQVSAARALAQAWADKRGETP